MALPKLNSNPKYELTIPSTGKKARFRPFLVKEEKALMIAMESGNQKDALNGLVDTILACTEDDIKVDKLTSFDIEYIFLQLRAKSVGETAKVGLKCKACGTTNETIIPLDDIKVEIPDIEKTIKLEDNISMEVEWPSFNQMISLDTKNADTETAFDMMVSCIKTIYTADERISTTEVSKDELKQFLESMNTAQFGKLKEFLDAIPRLKHDVSFSCKNCAESNEIIVEGVENFL